MLANGFAAIFGFAFWIIAARYYSTEDVGLAGALISVLNLLTVFAKFGFDWGLLRFLPKERERSPVINTCFTLAILMCIFSISIFVLGMGIWSTKLVFIRENWLYLSLIVIFTISTTLTMLQSQIYVALHQAQYMFIQNLILGIRLIVVGFLIFMGSIGIFSSVVFASSLAAVCGMFFIKRVLPAYRPMASIDRKVIKNLFTFSLANYFTNILATIPAFLMPLILVQIVSSEASAYFNIPFSLSIVIGIFISSISTSLLTEGAYDTTHFRSQVIKALKFGLIFVSIGILIFIIFGKNILLIYGENYAENSLWILWILALSYVPATIIHLFYTIMRVQLRMKPLMIACGVDCLLIFCFGYPLLKQFGPLGVAIAFLAARTLVAFGVGITMLRFLHISSKRYS
jgi:O-antigen/teichoic acid export membrane protein